MSQCRTARAAIGAGPKQLADCADISQPMPGNSRGNRLGADIETRTDDRARIGLESRRPSSEDGWSHAWFEKLRDQPIARGQGAVAGDEEDR